MRLTGSSAFSITHCRPENCNRYISDAQRASATELLSFFQEYQQQQQLLAARAKQLLTNQLEDEIEDEIGDDEEDEEEG